MIGTYSYPVEKLPIIEKFQEIAHRDGMKLSPLLMRLIEDYVKTHYEGNPQHLITSSIDNEDFMGFPAIALNPQNKRKYLKKMPKDMIEELRFNVQEWIGMLKEL